jgi:aminoglycoside phosphotransferase (APT) family kinase protein
VRLASGEAVFRKVYRYGSGDRVAHEYRATEAAWAAGVPAPQPLRYGRCPVSGAWFADFAFLPLEKVDPGGSGALAPRVADLARQLAAVPPHTAFADAWLAYREDLCSGLRHCLSALPPHLSPRRALIERADARLEAAPAAFVHGDFGPHNLGLAQERLMCVDFQWACAGPPGWDLGYCLACLAPESPLFRGLLPLADPLCAWPALTAAAVRVGRRHARGQPWDGKVAILEWWLRQDDLLEAGGDGSS